MDINKARAFLKFEESEIEWNLINWPKQKMMLTLIFAANGKLPTANANDMKSFDGINTLIPFIWSPSTNEFNDDFINK